MSPFIQKFGLHPLVAIAMISVDIMLFGPDAALGPIGWGISSLVALVLTIPCILLQRFAYQDEWSVAMSKGIIVGVLTAIPTPLPAVVTGAGGVLGLIGTIAVSLMKGERITKPKEKETLAISATDNDETIKLPPPKNNAP